MGAPARLIRASASEARSVGMCDAELEVQVKIGVGGALLIAMFAAQPRPIAPGVRLSRTGLSAEERREIVAAVARSAYDAPDSWEEELSATRIDLGASPGIVLRGTKLLCGATGNCQLFVMRKANGRWVSLFGDDQAPLAESFELGPGVTRGIKDLTVVTNSSAETGQRIRYRFDGQIYRRGS